MKNIKYAPVIIPTLNRYEHLKRCLESLEKCSGADKTDVYIGLDYPPSEKYVDGWKKVDAYLVDKEKNCRFNKVIVFRRDHNCGVGGPKSNSQLLKNVVETISDRYIFTEDDNEFSPNFLEFMNQSLEFYKDNSRVVFVSAYTAPLFNGLTDKNTFFGIDTPAYGLGHWTHKNAGRQFSNEQIAKELRVSLKRTLKLYWTCPYLVGMAVSMINDGYQYGDIRYSMYNLIHQTFTLQPSVSLSRTWGFDGSGVHSGVFPNRAKEIIQQSSTFEFQNIPYEYPPKLLRKLFLLNMPSSKLKTAKRLIVILIRVIRFYLKNK